MKKLFNLVLGGILIIGSIVGIVLSVGGVVVTWRAKPDISNQISNMFDLVNSSLTATDDMLTSINQILDETANTLEGVQTSAATIATTIDDASPAIDSVGKLVGEDMVNIITDTQGSLDSVKTSAQLIDSTLMVIASIPLIGAKYAPDTPLSENIDKLSTTLDPLPDELVEVQENLTTATKDLDALQGNINDVVDTMDGLVAAFKQTKPVIEQYQTIMDDLQVGVGNIETQLLKWLDAILWGATILFIWVGIAQIGLLTQGIEQLTGKAI